MRSIVMSKIEESFCDTTGIKRYVFSLLMLVRYGCYFCVGCYDTDTSLYIYLIGAVLSFVCATMEAWHLKFKRYAAIIWLISIIFCLPYTSVYVALMHNWQYMYLLYVVMSILTLTVFMGFPWLVITLSTGILGAVLTIAISDDYIGVIENQASLSLLVLFLNAASLAITHRIIRLHNGGVNQVMKSVASQLKPTISSISMLSQVIESIANDCDIIQNEEKGIATISNESHNSLQSSAKNIKFSANAALNAVNSMSYIFKDTYVDIGRHSLSKCIKQALSSSIWLSNEERQRVKFNYVSSSDIIFYGSKAAMIHIIVSLIADAFRARGGLTDIEISIRGVKLIFFERGRFFSSHALSMLFNSPDKSSEFSLAAYSCARIMNILNGYIDCKSVADSGTSFILTFPARDC